jgi:hypothetical protein
LHIVTFVYLMFTLFTSDPSPTTDEVLDKSIQDPLLKKGYKGMANRRYVFILFYFTTISE